MKGKDEFVYKNKTLYYNWAEKSNENTTTLQVQMSAVDIYMFFSFHIDKKRRIYEETKY